MRLDKFLKDSRLVKRRTIAKQMCDAGKVTVNDKKAKASLTVDVGDIIAIEFKAITLKVEVVSLRISANKIEAQNSYKELARDEKIKTE